MFLWFLFFTAFFTFDASAESDLCELASEREDEEVRVFLITLSPGEPLWSSFGHSAIWISDGRTGKDKVYNFGTFQSTQPNLLGRYLNGTLEYWLSVNSYQKDFKRYHTNEERHFVASRVLLPPDAAIELDKILINLRKPENRSYIYHWAKNSCATKIRDLFNTLTDNQIYEQSQSLTSITYRKESLRHLWTQPLVWLGWHAIANSLTDQPLTEWDAMYSPIQFRNLLKDKTYETSEGTTIPLIPYECDHPATYVWAPEEPPNFGFQMGMLGLGALVVSLLCGTLVSRSRVFKWTIAGLMITIGTITGLFGTVHAALFFSALEGLHPNLNQLLASPIHWLLVVAGVQTLKSKWSKAFTNSLVISGLSIVCVLLAVSGLSEQNNIEIVLLLTPIYIGFSGGLWLAKVRNGSILPEQPDTRLEP